jgi:hypothetical protein
MKNEREIEKLLEKFSPRPAPGELRTKVIQAARREADARRVLTPAWRWAMLTSAVLMAMTTFADWRLSSRERSRLSTLSFAQEVRAFSPRGAADEKAREVLAYLPDLDPASRQALRQSFLKGRRAAGQTRSSAAHLAEGINEY